MSDYRVYLAGPISGLSYDDAEDWRRKARFLLAQRGIVGLSPLRAKEALRHVPVLEGTTEDYEHLTVLATSRGIMCRDRTDATTSDALLVYLLGATRVSIGTVMEIAWAHQARKPVVAVMEAAGNLHDHAMINEAIDYRVTSLRDAIDVIDSLKGPTPAEVLAAARANPHNQPHDWAA